jgi:hypothetical protein
LQNSSRNLSIAIITNILTKSFYIFYILIKGGEAMGMFGFGKGAKKKDAQAQRLLNRNLTANQFINVKDIDGSIVYTKDNKLYTYIKIKPMSLELMSEQEQKLRGKQFTAEFSAIKNQYKFFSISRPVDVSFMLDNLNGKHSQAQELKRKEVIRNKIAEINRFAMGGEILEHNFFMVLWVAGRKDAQKELLKMANDIIGCFKACRMEVSLCKQSEIIKLFNLFANPNYAHLEDADINEHIPFVG